MAMLRMFMLKWAVYSCGFAGKNNRYPGWAAKMVLFLRRKGKQIQWFVKVNIN
jgi:hypothetical protein